VDFAEDASIETIADGIMEELRIRHGAVEVGIKCGQRLVLTPVASELMRSLPTVELNVNSVVVATGGARGITASVVKELAQRTGCHLVLLGRSAIDGEELDRTRDIVDPRALKAALIQHASEAETAVPLAAIEASFRSLTHQREMRKNLTELGRIAASVRYMQVDVADPAQLERSIQEVYRQHGRIDGVIHGAGAIEDKLLKYKTFESFQRVYQTKVSAALTLTGCLRLESLQFFVFFSSLAARFGNRGQCDYAAANEVLNKLALYLSRRWPCVVKSLNWGPWSGGGMVSEQLARQFATSGVPMIARESGSRACVDEILHGERAQVEVLLGSFERQLTGAMNDVREEAGSDIAPLNLDRRTGAAHG
jgi:NAD(P)-dependent dehydrogenase (short-subunit alcohol dehydrogenase family)